MNDRFAKLQESAVKGRMNESVQQGGVGLGGGRQVRGPVRSGKKSKGSPILPILLVVVGCVVFAFAAWSAATSPALASILSISSAPQQVQGPPPQSFAQVSIAKPTYTPAVLQPAALEILPTATFTELPPTDAPTQEPPAEVVVVPPDDPTAEVIVVPTATAEVAAVEPAVTSEGVAYAEIVPDTPTPEYVAPTAAPYVPPQVTTGSGGAHWIDVDLSQQRLYAYEGDTLVNSFVVSTGTWQTPTVTGKYKIWIKLRSAPMSGPGYYLPDVPYIMYFYKGYGIHGTYWHNNFGTPMSHGCVNMTIADAEWVYNFTSVGTVVNVHY